MSGVFARYLRFKSPRHAPPNTRSWDPTTVSVYTVQDVAHGVGTNHIAYCLFSAASKHWVQIWPRRAHCTLCLSTVVLKEQCHKKSMTFYHMQCCFRNIWAICAPRKLSYMFGMANPDPSRFKLVCQIFFTQLLSCIVQKMTIKPNKNHETWGLKDFICMEKFLMFLDEVSFEIF